MIREVDEGPPLRVAYRLTEAGAAMEPALKELGQWADTYLAEPEPGTGC
ncbi:Helix-turn-helix transcriptional regulator OS=Streptomyces microflavus OX=1919 GN=G3I39_36575 PE=4 SV=1 [Streptomyces microflavus]